MLDGKTEEPRFYSYGPIETYLGNYELPPEIKNPASRNVKSIVLGEKHLFALLDNGVLLMSGSNKVGQLGLRIKDHPEVTGLQIHPSLNSDYEILEIGAGSNHSVFLTKDKTWPRHRHLLTCGHKDGLGVRVFENTYKFQDVSIPELKSLDQITFLVCKFNANAVLDDQENLYFWGDYFDGFKIKTPEKVIDFEDKLTDLSFGFKHGLALVRGKVYSWGDGTYGELGHGDKGLMISTPTEIKYFSENGIEVVKGEAGSRHSLVLAKDGQVYGFGFNGTADSTDICARTP